MFSLFSMIAQVAPDATEVTTSMVAASLIIMIAMGGSLMMLAAWNARRRAGQAVFPAAHRKPLIIPLPLLGGGILMTTLMALLVFANNGDAATTETTMQTAMLQTINMNGMLLVMFGVVIWLSQQFHSRQLYDTDDVTYKSKHQQPAGTTIDDTSEQELTNNNESNPYASTFTDQPSAVVEATDPEQSDSEPLPMEGWNFFTELRFAAEAFLAAYLPTSMMRVVILQLLPDAPSHPFLELMEQGVSNFTLMLILLMAVVVAPVVEEMLYRVTILGGFMQQNATNAGWIVSSVLFGFAHGFPDSIALLPLAAVIGYTYIRRRSYRTVILIHLLFNAFNMVIAGLGLM